MSEEQNAQHHERMPEGSKAERRLEKRCEVSAEYQRYVQLRVKSGKDLVPAVLNNFNRHGILFESKAPFDVDQHAECIISIPRLLSQKITLGIAVKYCNTKEQPYIIGAVIDTIADATWFNVFVEMHDVIVQRQDRVC